MKLVGTRALVLALGVQMATTAGAAAQTHPTDEDALAATLSSAWNTAVSERARAATLQTPQQKLVADAGFAGLAAPQAGNAILAAVDASAVTDAGVAQDAVARVDTATTYEQLRALGKANEQAAYRRKREAGRYDPPLKDEKGYYFDVVQTWNYRHAPRTDEVGLQPPEYYAAMRCRAAPRAVGPLADNPNWKRSVFWRVCPDETGRYRPAM
jgi:hypothetical protein